MADLKLGVGFPGEALAVAIIEGITKNRETMSQTNRDKFDAMALKSMEEGNKFWGLLLAPLMKALEKAAAKET